MYTYIHMCIHRPVCQAAMAEACMGRGRQWRGRGERDARDKIAQLSATPYKRKILRRRRRRRRRRLLLLLLLLLAVGLSKHNTNTHTHTTINAANGKEHRQRLAVGLSYTVRQWRVFA